MDGASGSENERESGLLEEMSGTVISDQVPSTRSVDMSLARRFNAGIKNFAPISGGATRRQYFVALPGLEKGRAKLTSTLSAENTSSELPEVYAT